MSYVYVERRKTRQFGKHSDVAIHIKKPTSSQLIDAIDRAASKGFTLVVVYDSSVDLRDLADMVCENSDQIIGWSDFCQTVDAFKVNFGKTWGALYV